MLFSEPLFFVFFALVFSVYWILPWNNARKTWLLVVSYVFYGAWDWRFLFLIFATTAVNFIGGWLLGRSMRHSMRLIVVWCCVAAGLFLIGVFKYYNFFVVSASDALHLLGINVQPRTLPIILPVGISFFTFQAMSYVLDVYRGEIKPIKNFTDFALFVGFFPHLLAGPIVRAVYFLPQLESKKFLRDQRFQALLSLFLVGFVKKVCIADNLAPYVDAVFGEAGHYGACSIWIAVLCYAVQIYCDFSGYTDMAIAVAQMLGYDLGVNFLWPYFSANIQEFWRRWHISLSNWLRNYLYFSLGGNRGKNRWFTHRNLMITMLLGGLWHGASWNFVLWGGMHGLALFIHREFTRLVTIKNSLAFKVLSTAFTFYFVCVAWILFRSHKLTDSWILIKAFLTFSSEGTRQLPNVSALPYLLAALLAVHWIEYMTQISRKAQHVPVAIFAFAYGLLVALILPFVPLEYRPFVYFQF